MYKNITALLSQVNAAINPSAPVGGINATSHNAALLALIDSVGWWSALHYAIGNSDGDNYPGVIMLEAQNYNDSTLSIKFPKVDSLGIDNSMVLNRMSQDSIIMLRDIDGDVATWKVTSVSTSSSGGVDYYDFELQSASTNSDKTLGVSVSKKCGVTLFPMQGASVKTLLNITLTDLYDNNTLTVDFSEANSFRFEFDSIDTGGATHIIPTNLIDGQSGYISFEMLTTIGNSQFVFDSPFVMAADTPLEALAKGLYYEYRVIKDKVIIFNRYSLVTI